MVMSFFGNHASAGPEESLGCASDSDERLNVLPATGTSALEFRPDLVSVQTPVGMAALEPHGKKSLRTAARGGGGLDLGIKVPQAVDVQVVFRCHIALISAE
jgi:hypothetical protein